MREKGERLWVDVKQRDDEPKEKETKIATCSNKMSVDNKECVEEIGRGIMVDDLGQNSDKHPKDKTGLCL